MPLGIYNTAVLNGVVDNLKRPQAALLSMFFPMVNVSDKAEIKFDVIVGKRRLAPFVSPMVQGKVVETIGQRTDTFTPAYVKDKRVMTPADSLKRLAGEQIGGAMTPEQRREAKLVTEMADQTEMLTRRLESMASEVMRTGKVTVTGDGYPTVVVDFGRNAAHTVALAPAVQWGNATVKPLADVKVWATTMLQNSGAPVSDVVMDPLAMAKFQQDPDVQQALSLLIYAEPNGFDLTSLAKSGVKFIGTLGGTRYWEYMDWYIDPATGVEVPMLPPNTVILSSTTHVEGVRHFGAILDEEAMSVAGASSVPGYSSIGFSREVFMKSWVQHDPSVRYLMMQSAPLVVPFRPNATFCATVA